MKKAFIYLGIENEFYGRSENIDLKFSEFCEWHRITKRSIVVDKVFDERKHLYTPQKRYTLDELKDNFMNVYNKFGRTPTYNEFNENTSIPLNTYANKLKLSGVIYETLIEMYLSKEDKIKYAEFMKLYRKKLGETKGALNFRKCNNMDLENNFKMVFDNFYKNMVLIQQNKYLILFLKLMNLYIEEG